MMQNQVVPKIKERFKLPFIFHKKVWTQGIGESALSELISDWEDSLAAVNNALAYLPQPGTVRLPLSTKGENEQALQAAVEQKIETRRNWTK